MTRSEAKLANLRYYNTNKVCVNGHVDKRFVHNGSCYTCVQQASKQNWLTKRLNLQSRQIQIFKAIKNRCLKTQIEFNLDLQDIIWPDVCPVLGFKLNYIGMNKHSDLSPSFDRIDPNKGYIKGNVKIISNRANRIKYNASLEEIIKVALYIVKESNDTQHICQHLNRE